MNISAGQIPAIDLAGLTLGYGSRPVLEDLSGSFAPGSLTAILGPNGSGKSTLAKAIAGVLSPRAGTVTYSGGASSGNSAFGALGYLPQQSELRRDFPITVYDVVALGLWRQIGNLGGYTAGHRKLIDQALGNARLTHLVNEQIGSLSGGQFQRVLFARLMVQNAPVILLDEPFTAIDQPTTSDLLEVVAGWHAEGRTVIAVLHNVEMVEDLFPRVLVLGGDTVAWGDTRQVLADYDHALLGHGIDADTKRRFVEQIDGAA
jgi:zinc/manganese transport system ATP-binding protein